MAMQQSARVVAMIRPSRFFPNPETAADNAFQGAAESGEAADIATRAQEEFDEAVSQLRAAGITVELFDDTASPEKPDAVFPNNWFSTHQDGRVALYPMYSAARRRERRADLIDALEKKYRVSAVIDYSPFEQRGLYLEGTGSLVLDHLNRTAYVSLSRRASRELVEKFCADFNYEAVTFESFAGDGRPIYHTNVMMCLGTKFALIGAEMIPNRAARECVVSRLESTGRELILLTREQIANFAGNALELQNEREKLLVLSVRAAQNLTAPQREAIERHARLVILSLPTIQLAGGSARCMLAEIFLPPKM
jgi:hypothetical protein